ncbi:MAG: HEPN domain-containing protein [Chloroflexi bacterium]|nr:MAG: HEPN domain-containing protein [Chloroflexota bacterium]
MARDTWLRENRVPYLGEQERRLLKTFLARLEQLDGGRIRRVILFGSRARGDAGPWSDVDVVVVGTVDREALQRAVADLEAKAGLTLSLLCWSPEEYRRQQRLRMPLYVNLRREGIELWDEEEWLTEKATVPLDFVEGEVRFMDEETRETIRLYVQRARRDLQAARELQALGYGEIAVSRAYYAAFYSLTAALYALNVVRRKPTGLRAALSQFLVKTGLVEEEFKDIYGALFDQRHASDYHPLVDLDESQIERLLTDAERFVARMEQFLQDQGAFSPTSSTLTGEEL